MKEKLTVSCEGKPCYDIVLTIGFEELAGAALSVSAPERKICDRYGHKCCSTLC